jgi:hypothetical protein
MTCEKNNSTKNNNIYSVEDGTIAWSQNNYDTINGNVNRRIERQVRLVAGLIVLVGVILGFTISQKFFILSGFVGAGLSFAAITNSCMIRMALMKLPYNQPKNFSIETIKINLNN